MDGSSTPNREAEPNSIEDISHLGGAISRKPQLNKGLLAVLAVGVVLLLVAVNGGFSHEAQQETVNHHYTIEDHLGAPPEPLKPKNHSSSNSAKQSKSNILHTGEWVPSDSVLSESPHYTVLGGANQKQWTPQQRKQLDGLLAYSQPMQLQNKAQTELNTEGELTQKTSSNSLKQQLQPSKLKGSLASRIVDPNLFITKGAFLDCILETAISSDVPGMTRCQLSRDIYSTNGKVLLLEKGSHIVGQYQGGLQQGVARIFVLWSRIETPNGVIIDLDSTGTDPLGRSGHTGFVDGHFKQRFGSAILLSLIGDVGQYAANRASNGDKNQIQFGDTIGGTKDLASIALQDSIGIKPTLLKNQGEHINVFVARDLDFRSVYDLRLAD